MSTLPEYVRKQVSVDSPGALSHQLSFRCVGGKDACHAVCNYFRNHIEQSNIKIRDSELRVAIEISPDRRATFKVFYRALDFVKEHLQVNQFDFCQKVLKIYSLPEYTIIGEVPKGSSTFSWNAEVCDALQLDTSSR